MISEYARYAFSAAAAAGSAGSGDGAKSTNDEGDGVTGLAAADDVVAVEEAATLADVEVTAVLTELADVEGAWFKPRFGFGVGAPAPRQSHTAHGGNESG